jgi:uncharacterized protein DUF4276
MELRLACIPRSKLVKQGELERAVELAARQAGVEGCILLLLDSDDDCAAELGPELLARMRAVRADRRLSVVLACREFESWFLAGAESLCGRRGLAGDLTSPADPEAIRGAKEWLTARLEGDRRYVETLDQAALAAILDLQQARRAPSFERFCRKMTRLLGLG